MVLTQLRVDSDSMELEPSGFFAVRTPLLPFDTLLEWAHDPSFGAPVSRAELVARLRNIVRRPEVREAIFLASASTHDEITRWLETEQTDPRLERTLTRYLQRMAGRPTPFGLFAGCSVGSLGSTTDLALGPLSHYRRSSRIDNESLAAIAVSFRRREDVRERAVFRANSSLYRLGQRWRYVQTVVGTALRIHTLVALEGDEYLDAVIAKAREGASVEHLVRAILQADPDGDIPVEDARAYILELVDRDVLVTDIEPLVTGGEPLADLIGQFADQDDGDDVMRNLRNVAADLDSLNVQPLGIDVSQYQRVVDAVAAIGLKTDVAKAMQVDLLKPTESARLGPIVLETIQHAVRLLQRMAQPSDSLRRFRDAFAARYERREVPLVEVLDEESGIGFDRPSADATPLLDGIPFDSADNTVSTWAPRDGFLLNRITTLMREGGQILELSDPDIEALQSTAPVTLPDALSVMASVATSRLGTEDDCSVLIRHVSGPSGMNILGRFCRMDPTLNARVVRHLEREEALRPNAIFAEIVHLPAGRLANILGRPVLRRFEIPYLGRSAAPREQQIPISDLLVSVQADRVVLRSARLDTEIIPRMTTMHNFSRGQSLYRFLCTLQYQGVQQWLAWTWGALETSPFLPRVIRGRVVLARARWRLEKSDIASWLSSAADEQSAAIERWRQRWNVPRHLLLIDGDNELPVDFNNALSVETLLHLLKRRDHAVLQEMFPQPERLATHGPEGRFVHELIVPFVQKQPQPRAGQVGVPAPIAPVSRSFAPGTNWLYAKLYAGTSSVDRLLTGQIPPLIASLQEHQAIRRWFFLRYADPDWHLRLRFNGDTESLLTRVLPELRDAVGTICSDLGVWRVQFDTYEREIERYGGAKGIDLSEDLFHIDSEAVIQILPHAAGDKELAMRWQICLRSWDLLLDGFGFTLEKKCQIARNARNSYAREFRMAKEARQALGFKFRRERKMIEASFDGTAETTDSFRIAMAKLRERSIRMAPVLGAFQHLSEGRHLTMPLESIAVSHLHLNACRILRSQHRRHEAVLFDFLVRLYESRLGRARGRAGS